MPRRKGMQVCTVSGCPNLTPLGRCTTHAREADRARGSSTHRGYGTEHRHRFRTGVLARDRVCVLCHSAPAIHADHHPHSRDQLITKGMDPNDPAHGRGLCPSCHSKETAMHQPGGWHH